ncbi:hypothetical protein QQ045_023905 [Rhodiola kirilowii]
MALHSLHLVYYYRNNPGGPFDLDGLRISLSKVLSMYPAVTGRLARDGNGDWEVNCNDAGVRVLKANVDVTLDEWLKSADGCQERLLTAWENMPEDPAMWSPFRIQVNDFVGGGLAIGLSCSHMHTDLTFAATLFQAWTMAHRHQPIGHPPSCHPFWPRASSASSDRGTKSASRHYEVASKQLDPTPLKMATAQFKFSDYAIKQCLAEIHLQCANATPFDLLAAIFWKSIENSNQSDVQEKHALSVCMDFRKLLSKPLPLGYFGNAQHFSQLSVTHEELNAATCYPI